MLQQGSIIGDRYEIVDLLGGGGMKQVWLARDRRLGGRLCALAEMIDSFAAPKARAAAEAAFRREAELLGSLSNEHIPQVYDSFSERNAHYLVMEYVRGETLENKLNCAGRLDEQGAGAIALQIADTLRYLHSCNPPVIYRDLKPSNVILKPSGEVMLVDFGIARHFRAAKTATMVGTPGYAAPEQWKGKAEPRSDVYALGALLHQMLSGRDPSAEPPFSFPSLKDLCPACTPEITALVDESLEYQLDRRVCSVSAFRKRLVESRKAARTPKNSVQVAEATTVSVPRFKGESNFAAWLMSRSRNSLVVGAAMAALIGLAVWNNPSPNAPEPAASPSAESSSVETPEPSASDASSPLVKTSRGSIPSPEADIAPRPEGRAESTESAGTARASAAKLCVQHFAENWTRDQVRSGQGAPTGCTGNTWWFGGCWVRFSIDGGVAQWGGPWRPASSFAAPAPEAGISLLTTGAAPSSAAGREATRPRGYFTIGSTKRAVLEVQGTPDSFTDDSFTYGFSTVYFSDGRVTSWRNSLKELKVRLLPESSAHRAYFTLGSTKDEVLAIQGTPDSFSDDSFTYGFSTVYFSNGRVTSWRNSLKELKVRLLPETSAHRAYFTVGSTKDEVLAIQGTPDSFSDDSFTYGFSTVYFSDGRVTSWRNSLKELKVRMTIAGP